MDSMSADTNSLYRRVDIVLKKMPPVLTGLLNGELAWRQHDGGHTDSPNFKYFIPWASGLLKYQVKVGQ